jgi:hypothetical protein
MNSKNLNKLITEALAIEADAAKEAGAIGYMARVLTQATLPHKKVLGSEFTRTNGLFSLSILAPAKVGIPYGTIPRLLLSWLTTEAVRTKNPEIILGNTLSQFMSQLGLMPTGGRWGTIGRLREQMQRLFSSSVSCQYEKEGEFSSALGLNIAKEYCLWWHPKQPEQVSLWQSTVTLSSDFFDEITSRPVPIDMRALNSLKRSPLALDIYCWLTYRMSYIKKQTSIPWGALETQFGAAYGRTRDFKKKFLIQLKAVLAVYPEARVEDGDTHLVLRPSKPHIPSLLITK